MGLWACPTAGNVCTLLQATNQRNDRCGAKQSHMQASQQVQTKPASSAGLCLTCEDGAAKSHRNELEGGDLEGSPVGIDGRVVNDAPSEVGDQSLPQCGHSA